MELKALCDLKMLCEMLARMGVQRYRGPDGTELVFGTAPQPDAPAEKNPDQCGCSHSLATDHNEHGCLHGCPVAICEESVK